MANIVEIIKNYNVQLALKNIFSKIDEIIRYINSNPSGGGTVTSVTASSPLTSTGGENPNISISYTPENSANKGVANGYAPLASDAKVDAAYLPAYVDEVLEYANLAAFPVTGASDKIYIALDTNKVYRWSGSVYIEVAANSGVWGAITGTITNQADLVNYVTSRGYTLSMNCTSAFNPSDNQIYFIGALQANPFSNDTNLRLIVPKTGTIKSVVFSTRQALGSGESSTIALSVNGSYVNISTSILFNATNNTALITGLSRSVNAGDYVTIRWTCPTWVTNPTNVFINCIIYIE